MCKKRRMRKKRKLHQSNLREIWSNRYFLKKKLQVYQKNRSKLRE